jgi:hypothetical protein
VYHVPSLSANLVFVPQLTHTSKKVEFWLDQCIVKDMHNNFVVSLKVFLILKIDCVISVAFPRNIHN